MRETFVSFKPIISLTYKLNGKYNTETLKFKLNNKSTGVTLQLTSLLQYERDCGIKSNYFKFHYLFLNIRLLYHSKKIYYWMVSGHTDNIVMLLKMSTIATTDGDKLAGSPTD